MGPSSSGGAGVGAAGVGVGAGVGTGGEGEAATAGTMAGTTGGTTGGSATTTTTGTRKTKQIARYILFDGDVDAEWVENMNSVMDDNKLLTLPNGERIRLQDHCKLLFEVADLQYASPATISRCGMVYLDPRNLGYKPVYIRWCALRPNKDQGEALLGLCDKYVPRVVEYIFHGMVDGVLRERLATIIPLTAVNTTCSLTVMLEAMLKGELESLTDPLVLESVFQFCLVWAFGGPLVSEARVKFDGMVKKVSDAILLETPGLLAGPGQLPTALPTLFEYMFDVEESKWVPWQARVGEFEAPADNDFHKMMVPTVDTVRNTMLLDMFVRSRAPVLFVGGTGTAKTVTIQSYVRSLPVSETEVLAVNFSNRTSSADFQRSIEANVDRRTTDTYGPTSGKRLIVFVDDLNMPRIDIYGTQQPLALMKQLMSADGMYDRNGDLRWIYLRDVQYAAAMAPPGGGANAIDPRLVSCFNVQHITEPSNESLERIFNTMLEHHLAPFPEELQDELKLVTEMSLSVYRHIALHLPPTPSKFHYIFNLRDLSRVFHGLMASTPDVFTSVPSFIRLWRNEVLRVFCDKLNTESDKAVVHAKVSELIAEYYPEAEASALADPLVFGDYMELAEPAARVAALSKVTIEEGEGEGPVRMALLRLYEDVGDYGAMRSVFQEVLDDYNDEESASGGGMSLVLFDDALEHLNRILRILRSPRGNALLVGVDGSGRKSLTRLAAYACGYSVFEITLTRGYDETAFREDLKGLYTRLGVENEEVVFLFTDGHVADESFLELINNMLTSGMVPALYDDMEKKDVINAVRDEMAAQGMLNASAADSWAFFVDKCRNNLHIVLSMSPVGDELRVRCRNFPGLVSNTVIDWYSAWPREALYAVADAFVEDKVPREMQDSLVEHMVYVHTSVVEASAEYEAVQRRRNFCTPKNYLDFISNYTSLVEERSKRIGEEVARLERGLGRLVDAGSQLDELNVKLQTQRKVLDEKTAKCNELIDLIQENNEQVTAKALAVKAKEAELSAAQDQILIQKGEAEEALAEALPALERAEGAVRELNPREINELRTMARPPEAVQKVCECVLILIEKKKGDDVNYKNARVMMGRTSFLRSLLEYMDKVDSIKRSQVKAVTDLLKRHDLFEDGAMDGTSIAGAALLTWVLAIVYYAEVAKKVNPKKQKVAALEASLAESEIQLKELKAQSVELQEKLEALSKELAEADGEKAQLSEEAAIMQRRLEAASKLMSGLGTERVRWTSEAERLKGDFERLQGDCMLAAAFLSYTGFFSFEVRQRLVYESWQEDLLSRGIPLSSPFTLAGFLSDDVEVSQWAGEGLPSDELSVQNGILTTRSSRWPLCIDPQLQAVNWIKKREGSAGLVVTNFGSPVFLKHVENAVQHGFPLLFEGIDEFVDPVLDPVLNKAVKVVGNRRTITLGDKEIDWNDDFRLYLTTRLANPEYAPTVFSKASIINFTVTESGLEDQLLNVVVRHEKEELEEKREALVLEMAESKTLLKELENSLLAELEGATGYMLDNEELIATLQETKAKGSEVSEKLKLAETTAEEVEVSRNAYRPAAARGSKLFFALSGMSAISPMYEFSLLSYLEVFSGAVVRSPFSPNMGKRLGAIVDALTDAVYVYGCTGLFERHKLTFSLALALKVGEMEVAPDALDFFLKGNISLTKTPRAGEGGGTLGEVLSERGWEDLVRLDGEVGGFEGLRASVTGEGSVGEWVEWARLEEPEAAELPDGWEERVDAFGKLCVLRVFRVDRVYVGVSSFVVEQLGERYVQPPVVSIKSVFEQSTPASPIVFVLSPGSDPYADLAKLADEMEFRARLKTLSLGQGQEAMARTLLETGATRGQWVMLMNCHLLTKWLKELEKILEGLTEPHKDFRLWLTTEPTDEFPIGILQRSLKVVTEPPSGLKYNMAASYAKLDESALSASPHPAFRSLVYVLSFFHAVVQERRKYGKIGWNVAYDFNESDFRVSFELLGTYLSKAFNNGESALPWGSLRYLIGEAMYGGRVTDDFDRRTLITYLDEYMGDFLFDTFQPFFFYADRDGEFAYTIPENGPVERYLDAIERMPQHNTPNVFGLHENAEVGYLTNATNALWENMINLQPRVGVVGSAASRESVIGRIARDLQDQIPAVFDLDLITSEMPKVPSPVNIVLMQELERFNVLVSTMRAELESLQRALVGEIGMSAALDGLAQALFNGALPGSWRRLAPATQKNLASWIEHFLARHAQYQDWVEHGEPAVMWLSGLHVPEAYLTALVQTTCRANGWPLDKSTLYTEVTDIVDASTIETKPESGCYVRGLWLEGARWDLEEGKLAPSKAKVLVTELPVLRIVPIERHKLKLAGTFKTPVYVTQERANAAGEGLVFEADLRSGDHESIWVLGGVGLCLNVR